LWIGVVEFAFVARTGAAAMLQRRAGGLVVRTRTVKAVHNRSRIHDIAVVNEPIGIPISRRARLMGASAIAGGTLRGLAVAARSRLQAHASRPASVRRRSCRKPARAGTLVMR
jgi:hypothetical protein